jgi:hypothetical protein
MLAVRVGSGGESARGLSGVERGEGKKWVVGVPRPGQPLSTSGASADTVNFCFFVF